MTAPRLPRHGLHRQVRVFEWEDAGALQNLAGPAGFDLIALVPPGFDRRPRIVPAHAESKPMKDGEVAFFWRLGLGL
jgi:hypothetical protein